MTTAPNNSEDGDSPKNNALTTGPPIIGIILNWWLFGILFMQYLLYLSHETRKDKKIIRAIVHFLFLLDTVQSILIVEDAFQWFVFNFGNYKPLFLSGRSPGIDSPFLDSIIVMTVQSVYCWRIWVLGQRRVFPIIIASLAFISCVCGIWAGIYDTIYNFVNSNETPQWYIPSLIWLWGTAATDVIIAATMVFLLKFKSGGCSPGIKSVIRRLLILTLETNALTAIVALVTIAMSIFPTLGPSFTNLYRIGGYVLGKLYTNCFMVLLNQRIYYENLSQEETSTTELGTLEFAHSSRGGLHSRITNPGAAATVEVSIIQFSETATQADFKSECGDNSAELGQSMGGIGEVAGAAELVREK